MPIPTLITDLSQTAGSNYPAGSDSPSVLDDVQRAHAGFIAQLRDGKGHTNPVTLASATTTDIGGQNSMFVEISGTTTITSFGTNYNGPRYLRFTGALTLTHNATSLNINGGASLVTAAGDTAIAIPNTALNGWNVFYVRNSAIPGGDSLNTLRIDVASATTTDLTANAPNTRNINITGTTTITAFTVAAGQTYLVRFNAALTLTNNGAIVTQTGANISTGAGDTCFIRSTAANVVEVMNYVVGVPTVVYSPPVRQTVLSGTVDSNGFSSFGGSTGSTTVTTSSTLIATAANGFASTGQVDRTGSITNPSWTSLSTNGTMYLYLDIASNGTCTTGSTTLVPVYQWGGTYSVTNNQFTFNIQAMSGQVGNGATAAQTYRVFVGEVTVAGGVVTAITWYALMGRFASTTTSGIPASGTMMNSTHNIGLIPKNRRFVVICNTASSSYVVGEEILGLAVRDSTAIPSSAVPSSNRTTMRLQIGTAGAGLVAADVSASTSPNLTGSANFSYRFEADRGW